MGPDKGCEMFDCPKCVTVCKQPHCVTHCQAPKPECEPVCEEPKCDWKCHKPACPKPKCELVCENPNCVPKVECCHCSLGTPKVATPFPFFKETAKQDDPPCCKCSKGKNSYKEMHESDNLNLAYNNYLDTRPKTKFFANKSHYFKLEKTATIETLETPNSVELQNY